jgi:hypothetical protein
VRSLVRSRLFWRSYVVLLLLVAAGLVTLGVCVGPVIREQMIAQQKRALASKAAMLGLVVATELDQYGPGRVAERLRLLDAGVQERITFFGPDGALLADSDGVDEVDARGAVAAGAAALDLERIGESADLARAPAALAELRARVDEPMRALPALVREAA